ncbi:hypothetical protein D9M68_865200 [compost metagenome]
MGWWTWSGVMAAVRSASTFKGRSPRRTSHVPVSDTSAVPSTTAPSNVQASLSSSRVSCAMFTPTCTDRLVWKLAFCQGTTMVRRSQRPCGGGTDWKSS